MYHISLYLPIIVLLVAFVAAAPSKTFDESLNESWNSFKIQYKKVYPSATHETIRRLIWEDNLRYIQKHNLEADLNKHTYRLGMNEYGDLTNKEYKQKLLGLKVNITRGSTYMKPANLKLPETVDWRTKGYVTPVKNQGQCGSCWAFSTTGSVEGQHFKKTGKLVSLSEQNLIDCSQAEGNHGCNGGLPQLAFEYIKRNGGIDTEESYPYTANDHGFCMFDPNCIGATVTGFVNLESGSELDLKTATATVGPISVGIDASHSSFQFYRNGVYYEPFCSTKELDHAVLVVGYGTYNDQDYWLVKNSWGTSWGLKGYVMMARNKNNQCGIASAASYPLV